MYVLNVTIGMFTIYCKFVCIECNKWITIYDCLLIGEPLHILRQYGISIKELDLLDEMPLTPDQIRDVCCIMYVSANG